MIEIDKNKKYIVSGINLSNIAMIARKLTHEVGIAIDSNLIGDEYIEPIIDLNIDENNSKTVED